MQTGRGRASPPSETAEEDEGERDASRNTAQVLTDAGSPTAAVAPPHQDVRAPLPPRLHQQTAGHLGVRQEEAA